MMELAGNYQRFAQGGPEVLPVAASLHALAADTTTERDFLLAALGQLAGVMKAEPLAVVRVARGKHTVLGASGPADAVSDSDCQDLLTESLDQEAALAAGPWLAAPLDVRGATGEMLVAQADLTAAKFDVWAGLLGVALSALRGRLSRRRRVRRLEAILEIAADWRQTQGLTSLLERMAEASTKLLGAERASIFLWDKANHTLVARPALGVDGGELRIPDDAGVVGQVVQTGELRRVDEDVDQQDINRSVDKQLKFRTRNLLCAPLRGRRDDLFGAFEMINKLEGNFTDDDEIALAELAEHAAIALETTQEYEQLVNSRNQITEQAAEQVQLIGDCPAVVALRSTIRRVADADLAVLVLGENGTGKEVAAQMIHYLSRRRNEPFVAVNCAALTETLLESELFGHEKGAFTDARESRAGKFELASGGTLFLDEIGDMSLGGQAKLLRVLEEKVVVRVGGSTPIHTDARILAATNQDLAAMVREKRFREDLFYRLNVVSLEMPPLRERGEDVLTLAEHFLQDFCTKARRRLPKLTAAAKKKLLGHAWPGNVRELRNLMERIAYLSPDDKVDADELAFILSPNAEGASRIPSHLPLSDATRLFQVDHIQRSIEQCRGNMTDAAKRLGLHRSNLYRKMRQLGMETQD